MRRAAGSGTHGEPGSQALPVFDLGLAPYLPVQALQGRLRKAVADGLLPGVLLLLEHPAVITLGSRGGPADLVEMDHTGAPAIPVCHSERGGAATLHAPGQLVSYPILPIEGHNLRRYVNRLEEVLLLVLNRFGIHAELSPGRPGLYVADRKIASLGLRCERWIASHGTSLNVSVDLDLFSHIISCAEPGLRQTSMTELTGRAPLMAQVMAAYCECFRVVFDMPLQPIRRIDYEQLEALVHTTL